MVYKMQHQKYWIKKIYPSKQVLQKTQIDNFVKPEIKIIIENWMLSRQK